MPSPFFWGGWKNFWSGIQKWCLKGLKSRKSCLYLKWYGSYWNVDFYRIRLKRGHALPPFFGGGGGKIFGRAFKKNAQKRLKSRKSCLYLKWYGSYWNVDFYRIDLKRGHAPPFLGGVGKLLVRHSKAMSKRGLNPKSHVYISNGMVVTEMLIFIV